MEAIPRFRWDFRILGEAFIALLGFENEDCGKIRSFTVHRPHQWVRGLVQVVHGAFHHLYLYIVHVNYLKRWCG